MRRSSLLVLACLLAFPLYLLVHGALSRATLVYDDLDFWFYPWKAVLYHNAHLGRPFTLWDPYEFSGLPHFADIQRQLLYPLNAIFYLVPTPTAMLLFYAAHFALAAVFTYRWMRLLGFERASAVTAGLCYSLSGFPMLHASQLPVLAAVPWIPAGLLTIERLLRRGTWREILLAGLYMAQAVLAGSPQLLYISLWIWIPYLVWQLRQHGAREALRPALLVSVALAALLVLPQMLATRELAAYALRGAARDYRFASSLSWPAGRFWSMFVPYALGNPLQDGGDAPYSFHELTAYFGAVCLLLAAWGTLAGPRDLPPRARQRGLWIGLLVVGAWIALGDVGRLHEFCYHWVPGFSLFRVPARWLVVCTMAIAWLSALGVQRLMRGDAVRGAEGILAGLGYALAARLWHGRASHHEVALFVFFWSGTTTVWALARNGRLVPRWTAACLVALVLGEFLVFDTRYLAWTPVADVGRAAAVLQPLPPWPAGRVMTTTSNSMEGTWAHWASYYNLSDVQGSNPLSLSHTMDYLMVACSRHLPNDDERLGLLDHDGFFVMGPDNGNEMLAALDLQWALRKDTQVTVQPAPQGLGYAWMVGGAVVRPRTQAILDLSNRKLDPRTCVTLERPYPGAPAGTPGRVASQVTLTAYDPDDVTFQLHAQASGYVVVSEVYYAGWTVRVDGREVPLEEGDGLLRCFYAPAGTHVVRLLFRPWWLPTLWLSAATLLVTLGCLLFMPRRWRDAPA